MTPFMQNASPSPPVYRNLRGYALDPSLAQTLQTVQISEIVFRIPWEELNAGPVGEYLEVIDFDPSARCFYQAVNLDDPYILAQDGLQPSEGTPQFHQQMVYAVSRLTIHNFERALGRVALWAPGPPPSVRTRVTRPACSARRGRRRPGRASPPRRSPPPARRDSRAP